MMRDECWDVKMEKSQNGKCIEESKAELDYLKTWRCN